MVGDPAWDEYLASRFAQVLDRADAVADELPDTRWAAALQDKDPALARQVIVWRAAHDVHVSDFRTCGPADGDDAVHQRRLEAFVKASVGSVLSQTDQWRPLVDRIAPGLADDPHWPVLARALTRAADAGFDVGTRLPELIAERPLPHTHAARSLDYRLANACPEAFGPTHVMRYEPPTRKLAPPTPLPDYAGALGGRPVNQGGPRR